MVCGNCGKILEEGEIFCPACGTRAEQAQEVESPQPGRFSSVTYTPGEQQSSVYTAQYTVQPTAGEAKPPRSVSCAEALPKEKEFFGKGAFLFCLLIIALLAGAAGAFAYMYFSLLGVL